MSHALRKLATLHQKNPKDLPARARRLRAAVLLGGALLLIAAAGRADEPYARSRDYDLQNARISLRFDVEQRKVMGQVTHTLATLRDGVTQLVFDSVDLTIEKVTVSGKTAKFQTTPQQLLVTLDHPAKTGEKFDVTIRYEGRPKKGLYFVLPDKNYPDRPKEIWTQGEAEDTRYYIPIYDYPNDRVTSEMILTVPRDWTTVSNGRLVSVVDAPGGMKTWDWRQSQKHSTYLIALAAGEFDVTHETWRNLPVTNYVPRGKRDRVAVTSENTPMMLSFFSDSLGVTYPWDKYAQAWVDDFVVGGMENTSATFNTATALQHPDLAKETLDGVDGLISHELAHQWFGDLVTCKDWANLWLNEGFATYFATLWAEHQYGPDVAAYNLWQARNNWMSAARLYPVPIVSRSFKDSTEYAGNIYTKGGWVLHMLRGKLGDAAFFRALHHYLVKHRGQNVVTADLVKAIEEATATNVDEFFDQWIYGAGAPRFRVSYTYDDSAHQVKLNVEQTQKVEGRVGLFRVPVDVEITTAAGRKISPMTASKASETFTFPADNAPLMVLFDKGDKILKSLEFNKQPAEWIYQLKSAADVPDRADAAKMLGEVKFNDEVVAALGAASTQDNFWGVRVEAVRALGRIGGAGAQKQLLAALANEQPWVRQVVVEQMGNFKDDPAVAEKLAAFSRDDKTYRVRGAALASLAQVKAPNALELLLTAVSQESPDDRLRIAALRATGTLGDDKAAPVLLNWAATGKPFAVRTAAIASLSRMDKQNKAITQQLVGYLRENYRPVQIATIFALGQRGDADAAAPLESLIKGGELSERLQEIAQGVVDRLKPPPAADKK